ncbi:hypothetical protein M1N57_00840 [Dehalococcoidales bacterium]|nr:hypothetical protein [Dehalococcoidales bacterium]
MNIISVDLPWQEDKKGRTLAIADLDGNIKIAQVKDDKELLELISEIAKPGSIILLDIPIDGCDNLGGKHFRPIDRAISRLASILPASKAGSRGKGLKDLLEKKRFKVYEIYPYAVYKFLAYLKDRNLLHYLNCDRFDALLDERFGTYRPPKYKRERKRDERLKNMQYLYSLLTDPSLGFRFSGLRFPHTACTLGDEYDACLGAIVGIFFARSSSYTCIAGDSNSGSILLLADQWLAGELGKEVSLSRPSDIGGVRGAKPLSKILPLPLIKGKGIKGMGLQNKVKRGEVDDVRRVKMGNTRLSGG